MKHRRAASASFRRPGGDDRLYGGPGKDQRDGGTGNDRIFGQGGIDRLYAGCGNGTVTGEAGDDAFITRNSAVDDIEAGSGTNTVLESDEVDEILNAARAG